MQGTQPFMLSIVATKLRLELVRLHRRVKYGRFLWDLALRILRMHQMASTRSFILEILGMRLGHI